MKKLIDLVEKSHCQELQLCKIYVRAEFMVILQRDIVEDIHEIPFCDILDVAKKDDLIKFMKEKIIFFVQPLHVLLDKYQRVQVARQSLKVCMSPEAKTLYVLCESIICNGFSNVYGSKHAHKGIMNEIREAGHVDIPNKYLTRLYHHEEEKLQITQGVIPSLLQFNSTCARNQSVVRYRPNKGKYIENFTMASKSHILSAYGRYINRPINYIQYTSKVTELLHKYSGNNTHGYYESIKYNKLRKMKESKQALLIKDMFLLAAACYRGDWQDFIFTRYYKLVREIRLEAHRTTERRCHFQPPLMDMGVYGKWNVHTFFFVCS